MIGLYFVKPQQNIVKFFSKKHLNTGSIAMTPIQIKLGKRVGLPQAYGECR